MSNNSTIRINYIRSLTGQPKFVEDIPVEQDFKVEDGGLRAIGKGAIVEEGSNSNGNYIRWDSGFQMCWNEQVSITLATDSSNSVTEITFPAAFDTSKGIVVVNANIDAAFGRWSNGDDLHSTIAVQPSSTPNTTFNARLLSHDPAVNFSGTSGSIHWSAQGYWK